MKVCIAGLGKIGLPLAIQFGSKGAQVVGYDISAERCDLISNKRNPLPGEPGLEEKIPGLVVSGRLRATTNAAEAAAEADVIIFIVPVDVDDSHRPDFTHLDAAVEALAPHVKRGALVIVETTVPVGTTRHRVAQRLSGLSGLKAGEDFAAAFSPERVSSGTVLLDLQRYPKIVGGIDDASTERAAAFYASMLDAEVLAMPDAETAEYSKLLETTYRDVNIALANEFARVGDALGVDTRAAIAAANTQPYSHIHAPGPGVGGHCIPVYPYFLAAPETPASLLVETELASAARRINDGMAHYTVDRLASAIGSLEGLTVIMLGLSYRAGVKEHRHSSTFGLASALVAHGATPLIHDPLYSADEIRALGLAPAPEWPTACDAIVVQAWETSAALDVAAITGLRAIVDARGVLERAPIEAAGVIYVGIGA